MYLLQIYALSEILYTTLNTTTSCKIQIGIYQLLGKKLVQTFEQILPLITIEWSLLVKFAFQMSSVRKKKKSQIKKKNSVGFYNFSLNQVLDFTTQNKSRLTL